MEKETGINEIGKARAFWWSLIFLLAFFEVGARVAYPWCLRYAPEGYLSSAAYVRDLLRAADGHRSTIIMGDSILGASALREHRVENPTKKSLSVALRQAMPPSHGTAVSIAADGMLPADMMGALNLVPAQLNRHLVVVLNVRMFSADFQKDGKDYFFPFLKPESGHETSLSLFESDEGLGQWFFNTTANTSTFFRTMYQMRGFWFSPNPQAASQVLIERVFGGEGDADLEEAILMSRVGAFYEPRQWSPSDEQVAKVVELARSVSSRGGRALIVMAPQNPRFFPTTEMRLQLRQNVETLGSLLEGIEGARFRSFLEAYPPEEFLDHCHLSPEGNGRFARAIAEVMESSL